MLYQINEQKLFCDNNHKPKNAVLQTNYVNVVVSKLGLLFFNPRIQKKTNLYLFIKSNTKGVKIKLNLLT